MILNNKKILTIKLNNKTLIVKSFNKTTAASTDEPQTPENAEPKEGETE